MPLATPKIHVKLTFLAVCSCTLTYAERVVRLTLAKLTVLAVQSYQKLEAVSSAYAEDFH